MGNANPEVHIVIAAAGQGKRMGADTNKLFLMLADKPLIVWTVEKAVNFIRSLDSLKLGHIHLICHPEEIESMNKIMESHGLQHSVESYIPGGRTRRESVFLALQSLHHAGVSPESLVLVQDGARCLGPLEVWQDAYRTALEKGAACPALPVHDTLRLEDKSKPGKDVLGQTVDRENLYRIQTPQAFHFENLYEANLKVAEKIAQSPETESLYTDDVRIAQEIGLEVYRSQGSLLNFKLTRPEDLALGERIVNSGTLPSL